MCLFLETIQLNNGVFMRLEWHEKRMKNALASVFPNVLFAIQLRNELNAQHFPTMGWYKCRVVYDTAIRRIEFYPYIKPAIASLKLINTQIPSLPYKLADRADYQAAFTQRGNCDDVLLVKNGLLTDTSYCNIALFDGQNWMTPKTPLVYGVNRSKLLHDNQLIEKDIPVSELIHYQQISLFNAMNEHLSITLPIAEIKP